MVLSLNWGDLVDKEFFEGKDRNEFIEENRNFIYRIAYKVCKRRLAWGVDEELSISMIAFNSACDSYRSEKGNFLSYSAILIKNSLIDYFRKSKNIPMLVFESGEENYDYIDNLNSLGKYQIELSNKVRVEEIALFTKELMEYKLDFASLVDASPKHIDTRNNILNIALSCSQNPIIINYIKDKKRLPVKEITILTGANTKQIEKWRKYLLTLILILISDQYPYIKGYLNIKVGDKNE